MAPSPFATPWERFAARLPIRLRKKVEQLGHDLSMLLGQKPKPKPSATENTAPNWQHLNVDLEAEAVTKPAATPTATAAVEVADVLHTRKVTVAEVVRETADAVTLVFSDPTGATFDFKPGQFFTLLLDIDGQLVRRAYSASSTPRQTRLSLTVKRVNGGLVSNFVNDRVKPGDVIEILGPSGSFCIEADAAQERELVLIAGGSGITPMMSIARTILSDEPKSRLTLLYGNRGNLDIIFSRALDELEAAHPERLRVRHVLQTPPDAWTGGYGLLDESTTRQELAELALENFLLAHFYVCGPEPMMAAARQVLTSLDVPAERLHEERFSQPHRRTEVAGTGAGPQLLTVERRGQAVGAVTVPEGKTLLETGLGAGLPMPFSCAMGGCGECMVKLVDGQVDMEEPNCLLPEERAKGYILACVSRPLTPTTVELP